jgi:anti-sigma B factor antagonist
MEIRIRRKDQVHIVDLDGRLAGTGATALHKRVEELLARGVTRLLVNLDGVDFMDSSGLGELGWAKRAAGGHGATIKLLHIGPNVRRVLVTAGAIDTFEIFDNEPDALASFGG